MHVSQSFRKLAKILARLTKTLVETTLPHAAKPVFVWDEQLPGFGVKVLPTGIRKYIVKYRAQGGGRSAPQRWFLLGTHGAITCETARTLAQKVLGQVASGVDPQSQRFEMRSDATLKEIWERFEQGELQSKKVGTQEGYRLIWRNNIEPKLGQYRANVISRADIDRLHKNLRSTPYHANRVLALLSRLYNLAEAWGVTKQGINPTKFVERFQELGRERFLSSNEIIRIGKALFEAGPEISLEAKAAIRLLLLTGARRNEILRTEWDWVDLQERVIRLPDSKTGKKLLYLSDVALGVIEGLKLNRIAGNKWLLPGKVKNHPLYDLKGPWRKVCLAAGLSGVRLHDLRHTSASIAVNLGASLAIIGRVLGHRQTQTTSRYAHVDIDPALEVVNSIGNAIGNALTTKNM